jgi:uncharacterized RDD family membrane protein YckC
MNENHYDMLGVEPTASRDELREAYRARVDELTAARDKKGITPSQLDGNRDEVAKVRSAWNVLSDPFQRQRYDAQVDAGTGAGAAAVDDGEPGDAPGETGVQLTGWRKLMAPAPPKPAAPASGNGKQPPPARPAKQPTIPLPSGMHIAQPRVRGMALLFDLAIVILLLFGVQYLVPNLIQSDYKDKVDQVSSLDKASSAQGDIHDARSSIADANKAAAKAQGSGNESDLKSAQDDLKSAKSDLKSAKSDFASAQKDFNDKQASQGLPKEELPSSTKRLDSMSSTLSSDIRGTQYITALVTLVLALLYLVPMTAMTGSTFGMRGRKIKVVRVDGSRAGWWPSFARFVIPLLIGLAIPTLGPVVALGIVLWGYRDANGQGVHDKLARTLVVDA